MFSGAKSTEEELAKFKTPALEKENCQSHFED